MSNSLVVLGESSAPPKVYKPRFLRKPKQNEEIEWFEPVPTRFYCPQEQHQQWAVDGTFPGEWLGEWITFGSTRNKVLSGPCCRLYYGEEFIEPHSFERSWEPKDPIAYGKDPTRYGKIRHNWVRNYPNYLSYLVIPATGRGEPIYLTVRWQLSGEILAPKTCALVCPLSTPLEKEAA